MDGRWFFCAYTAALVALAGTGDAATIDHIRLNDTIRIGYRLDAPPFSYQDADAEPKGFIVDLCRAVAKRLSQQVNAPSLKVAYVPVSSSDRFAAVQQDKIDMLCEATTVTMNRRKVIEFSVYTYVDGASLLTTAGGPQNLEALAGRSIGVLANTTTERALRNTLSASGISATVIPASTHADGLAMVDSGKVTAYFADRTILWVLQANSKAPGKLLLANEYLTIEPYALGLPKGDDDFRYEVDRALSGIYRSGEIVQILARTFGDGFQLSPMLQSVYLLSALPD